MTKTEKNFKNIADDLVGMLTHMERAGKLTRPYVATLVANCDEIFAVANVDVHGKWLWTQRPNREIAGDYVPALIDIEDGGKGYSFDWYIAEGCAELYKREVQEAGRAR